MRELTRGCLILSLVAAAPTRAAPPDSVRLPLSEWERMRAEIAQFEEPPKPDLDHCPVERAIDGAFRKGLFTATLTFRFEVLTDRGHVRVPVLDARASLVRVLQDGQRTSLFREGALYTVGVDRPGPHTVTCEFLWGQEQDRFARRLAFRLPDAGATRFTVQIPETDIEASLKNGALVEHRQVPGGTLIRGSLDPTGNFDLAWKRKITHRAGQTARIEASETTLFTVQDTLLVGMSVFDLRVVAGETDRVDLILPPGLDVTGVEGQAVLPQWSREGPAGARLVIPLRYLVDAETRITVRFRLAYKDREPVELLMPLPPAGVALHGTLGIQGPAGVNVQVTMSEAAELLKPRDLPPELTDLTDRPLQHGFRFEQAPRVTLTISRHRDVAMVTTVVDELQASSVVLEDGTEITKTKLRIRNNTEQYLAVHLPVGAELTHALIDGRPVRPATAGERAESLLFPLRQSERLNSGQSRTHVVRVGETLSDIANFYYSNPLAWQQILESNQLDSAGEVQVGQTLLIPSSGVRLEESAFVIEFAYKHAHRDRGALGFFGWRTLTLPRVALDRTASKPGEPDAIAQIDIMKAVWHVYLPAEVEPLSFDANLTQYSSIRYDPFRRVKMFLENFFWSQAWAGGGQYKSILSQRKEIYIADSNKREASEAVLGTFPLVGERYRFQRNILGQETARVGFTYAARWFATPLRWLALLWALSLTLFLAWPGRERTRTDWLRALGCLLLLLLLAHFVLGVHRRLLWGVDLGLLLILARLRGRTFWNRLVEIVHAPWRIRDALKLRNAVFLIGLVALVGVVLLVPILLSTLLLLALLTRLWWIGRPSGREVSHA